MSAVWSSCAEMIKWRVGLAIGSLVLSVTISCSGVIKKKQKFELYLLITCVILPLFCPAYPYFHIEPQSSTLKQPSKREVIYY